jgi:outer membrane protein TolC
VTAFKEDRGWTQAQPADALPRGGWWKVFKDPVLDGLEQKVDAANPTLAQALARYQAAQGFLGVARAAQGPRLGSSGTVSRNRQSDNRPLRGSNQPDEYAADSIGVQLDYEIDLLSATVDAYAKADAMTRRRFAGGIATGIETGQSGAQLAEAQAQLADLRNARALTEHAIASLVGTPAPNFSIEAAPASLTLPPIPAGLPSTLLQRRPDVAAAERRMYAANREIGVARAAFFPSISLSGQGGFQNTGLPGLFTAPNIFWSVGPSAVLNLFDGGRRRAQVAVARANWTQATADYRGDVLKAFQDVEDGLSQLHHLGDEAVAEDQAVTQAAQAERLSLNRYVKGAVDYLDVVTAQTTALRTRRQAIRLETLRLQASVGLIKALGGGWRGGAQTARMQTTPSRTTPSTGA